jgi:hypothetical protein
LNPENGPSFSGNKARWHFITRLDGEWPEIDPASQMRSLFLSPKKV